MSKSKKITICVKGMHCSSCDLLVRSKFEEVENVKSVTADHTTQKVELEYEGELRKDRLQAQIAEYGYKIVDEETLHESQEPLQKKIFDAVLLGMIMVMLYLIAEEMNLLPSTSFTTLSVGSAFLVGVVASLSTCMATTGALYLATIGKLQAEDSTWQDKLIPALNFNAGRLLTYAVMGMLNGFVGQLITRDLRMGTYLNVVVGILMIFVGLDMLRIIPLSKIIPDSWMKNFFLSTEKRLIKNPRRTAFLLGALTYWLPCGFTQSVQLYALTVADPVQSGLIMFVFALGTVPAMLLMGFATSIMKKSIYKVFMKVVAVLIVLIGFSYILNLLTLYGWNPIDRMLNQGTGRGIMAAEEQGEQVIRMAVTYKGYTPNTFTVKKGRPVKWIIDGKEVFGCQGYLIAPKIEVETVLKAGENVISFFPEEVGSIGFSCSMGMYNGHINVIE